ncbi:helix-turn-helix transcriptional regulator [Photobacterium sp. MCCC 1A19761]|uniref:AraC family transcriptional regulator n=1 Tax=Photobacterium sp. MCCC 1A19761 TaxID=3115000 RepID=UPI00307DB06A
MQNLVAQAHHYDHGDCEPLHTHTTTQLLHTISGVLRIDTPSGSWVVPPGRGLWIPAGIAHSLQATGSVEVRTLFLDPLARADLPGECGVFSVSPLLRELIVAAVDIPQQVEPGSRDERLVELILDELRGLPLLGFHVPVAREEALKQLCDTINQRIDHPWSISDASQILNVSERTVSRKFHQQLGLNFGEWLRRQRLLRSMELLAAGHSVIEAALAVGYESPGAFSQVFKSRVGLSPTEYLQAPASDSGLGPLAPAS